MAGRCFPLALTVRLVSGPTGLSCTVPDGLLWGQLILTRLSWSFMDVGVQHTPLLAPSAVSLLHGMSNEPLRYLLYISWVLALSGGVAILPAVVTEKVISPVGWMLISSLSRVMLLSVR